MTHRIDVQKYAEAIVCYLQRHPGLVESFFVTSSVDSSTAEFEAPSLVATNWILLDSQEEDLVFDCEPYDDQVRAYIETAGEKILSIEVQGE